MWIHLIGYETIVNEIFRIRSFAVKHKYLIVLLNVRHGRAFDLLQIQIVMNALLSILMVEEIHHWNQCQLRFTILIHDIVLSGRNSADCPSIPENLSGSNSSIRV